MELIASIRRNAVGLAIFAVVTAGFIGVTQYLSAPIIADNIVAAQRAAFNEVLPHERYNNDITQDVITLAGDPLLGTNEPVQAFIGRLDGEVSAIIFETKAPGGYNGSLDLIVAIDKDGVVTGARVIAHKETPGLGDKVDLKKSSWIESFAGKSFLNLKESLWGVKKDGGQFDQFTGATITPRAVVKAVKNTLIYFEQHKAELLAR
ncbi:electron transport complex subunit RsxG [Maribrevibacterium harenarium]|uniref:Ion-translocating oxidoreductase complex subunit G n=1 Tax=Maribrevibacterium harenarium TaxID=2589817 RepID=A0A501WQ30_9GAMM|nr:electron transport complex subunit RsxG [Maribrevibacterium harenarium]TPE51569.1 electron transport complex subunit RsxG [Maribrevibacterium harenarium]